MSEARRRLILDLDTGVDDALALAYALGSPGVEVAAVICSYGNVSMRTAVRNTCAVLDFLGHPEVPVFSGVDRALVATAPFSPSASVRRIHGENGLGGALVRGWCRMAPQSALGYFREVATRGGDVEYVATGPLTNLATELVNVSGLGDALGRVTFMGGALAVPGNVTPCAEANIANDPAAADAVLRGGLKTRMIGLDVTHQVVLTRDDTAAWRNLGTPAARFFADMVDHYITVYKQNNPQLGGCALHDPLAVAAALDPSLVRCLPANLCVDLEGPTRGRTVCDPDRLRDAEKSCEVALEVDAARFLDYFRVRMARALS